jgi:pSer/pThr/pTyr-binding forkhead associated (FHA) protein
MATLVYTDVDGVDRSFALGADPVMVGRSSDCAIRSEDPRVSRMHAKFYVDHGQLWVEDLGSSNGIYVGPQKVQRAPVPIGEIVLIGSLMIRLLPVTGTMPPPIGLHGTLAQWLEMERKARAAVEEERNAFAKRVGELHDELRIIREAQHALQDEERTLRTELDELRRRSVADIEAVRLELAKAKEDKIVATTSAGLTAAEKLAEMDGQISRLQNELITARAQVSAANNEPKARAP